MFEKITFTRPKDQRSLIIPALGIVLLLLIPILIVPQVQLLFQVAREIEDQKFYISKLENKRTQLTTIGDEELRANFLLSSAALPSSKDVGGSLVALDALAQEHRVTIVNFTTTDTDEKLTSRVAAPAIAITVTVQGGRQEIQDFVDDLGRSLPLMNVKGIALIKNKAAIALASYYKPIDTKLPPPELPLPLFSDFNQTIATLSSFTKQTSFVEGPPVSYQEDSSGFNPTGGRENPFF